MTHSLELTDIRVSNISSASATLSRNSELLMYSTRFITDLTQAKLINMPVLFRVQMCYDLPNREAKKMSIHTKTTERDALLTSVNLANLHTADRLSG
jgi:uncharacterized protein YqiB (DUF1249 family)